MRHIEGDLWDQLPEAVVAITTCGQISKKGECIMLRGCARQARERFPGLALKLGELIREGGNHVHDLGNGVVSFPVEEGAFDVPDLRIIERSCRELVALTESRGWQQIVVPRPGCGGGGLQWETVRPILEPYFDDRFSVISFPVFKKN